MMGRTLPTAALAGLGLLSDSGVAGAGTICADRFESAHSARLTAVLT